MEEWDKEYREYLVLADQKSVEDYDKTVLLLSGGALGVSFAFVKDFVGSEAIVFPFGLFFAWAAWGMSVTSVLASYFFSHKALRYAIGQVDAEQANPTGSDIQWPGGRYSVVTDVLNVLGGVLFLIGVVLMIIFVHCNLEA